MSRVTVPAPTAAQVASVVSTLDQVKHQPPRISHTIPGHDRLLAQRPRPSDAAVVSVVAPAGYGKSTALAAWVAHDPAQVLWVTLDSHDDDPVALVGTLAGAVLEAGVDAPDVADAMRTPSSSVWSMFMPRLTAALHHASPFTLVFDDAHAITGSESWDVIDWLMLHVPEGSQVIVSGRSHGGSSTARLTLSGHVATIGASDLALSDAEAQSLMTQVGIDLSGEAAAQLNQACDGWVSGLLMSGPAVAAGHAGTSRHATGEHLIEEYLRHEVLEPLGSEAREFLLQTSALRLVSAPLCDAVLERSGSHALLEELCDANAFLVRVGDGWCKLHELLRTVLLRQLEARDPDLVVKLRDRAATWFAERGGFAKAIHYSMESGLTKRTADLIGQASVVEFSAGRQATIDEWLDWAEATGLNAGNPQLVLAASMVSALTGRPERSERWAGSTLRHHGGAAERADCPRDNGHCALVAAWQSERGAESMLEDASRAVELLADDTWAKSAQSALAMAQLMCGLDERGVSTFRQVIDEAGPGWADTNARSGGRAMLASMALRDHDLEAALELLEDASALREENGITEQGQQALQDAVAARAILMSGAGVAEARRLLAHAQRVRGLVSWAIPSLALALRLELIKAHLALADVAGARVLVRETADILHHRPGLGTFEAEASQLQRQVAEQAETVQGPSSLTTAELRLVPWLATHLSFREIGERLFLSTNTVKTEALSTYRKLGASSRSEAVEAAVRVGLLDSASLPGILGAGAWMTERAG